MKLPQRFSYRRSLSPSVGIFTYLDKTGQEQPLPVKKIKILGQKEGVTEGFDKEMKSKLAVTPKRLAEGNPHTIEYSYVPFGASRLFCRFSLNVSANSVQPEVCSEEEVASAIRAFVGTYRRLGGYRYLAERYLRQILSGAWLWRNRETLNTAIYLQTNSGLNIQAEGVQKLIFTKDWEKSLVGWSELVTAFEAALTTPQSFLLCEIVAEITPTTCQEVYTSQAFNDKDDSDNAGRIFQKTLVDGIESPIFGAYKIGAALALIDDWFDVSVEPVRVGQYGVNKATGNAYRSPQTGQDFYSLITRVEQITEQLNSEGQLNNEAHFIAANLIKGGLFQQGSGK